MSLRDILTDKNSINILKALFDKEVVLKEKLTADLDYIKKKATLFGNEDISLDILNKEGLILMDNIKGKVNLAITDKGKQFLLVFDQLVRLTHKKVEPKKQESFKIEFNLTKMEKKLLIIVYKMNKESGGKSIPLQVLAEEIYPGESIKNKSSTVSSYVGKLCSLQLLLKEKHGRETLINITERGEKTIKDQMVEEIMKSY